MPRRRCGRIAEAIARGSVVGVAMALVGGTRREYVLGPFRASATQLFFACIFVSLAALLVLVSAMPREVWREDAALMATRAGRAIRWLPVALLFGAALVGQFGHFRDEPRRTECGLGPGGRG
jgi:hypothetical protein